MALPESLAAKDLVAWAERELRAASESARLDAELLLAATASMSRAQLIAYPERLVGEADARRLAEVIARRGRGEPIAYIVGSKEFRSLSLRVSPAVLVPRPETELIVEAALERAPAAGARVLDLGTGSGAIALALKHERPDLDVTAVDRSAEALAIARANAGRLGLAVRFVESNWLAALAGEVFDLILANPPYVASGDPALAALEHEPRAALDGGEAGMDAYRAILAEAAAHVRPGGALLFEHGFDQRPALAALASAAGFRVAAALDDLAGLPRVLALERAPKSARDLPRAAS
jgi:release factor glutamine methyltransferase